LTAVTRVLKLPAATAVSTISAISIHLLHECLFIFPVALQSIKQTLKSFTVCN
jgi:hypothetical protein